MPIVDIDQNTEEWHEWRRGKIGASMAPIIMGDSPWLTPHQLWQEMLGLRPARAKNAAMTRGLLLEQEARDFIGRMLEQTFVPRCYESAAYPWMIASIDAVSTTSNDMVEIKCPGAADHRMCLEGRVPSKYYAQLQHQLYVTDAAQTFYMSYRPGEEYGLIIVQRDEAYIEKLVSTEKLFYYHVQNHHEPHLTERDFVINNTDTLRRLTEQYRDLCGEHREISTRLEQCKQELIALAANHNVMGDGIKISRIQREGIIDYKAIPELCKVDLERYRKPSTVYWTIALT